MDASPVLDRLNELMGTKPDDTTVGAAVPTTERQVTLKS